MPYIIAQTLKKNKTIWEELSRDYDYSTKLFTNNKILAKSSNIYECFDQGYFPNQMRKKKIFDEAYGPLDNHDISGLKPNLRECISSGKISKSLINCSWQALVNIENELRNKGNYKTIPGDVFTNSFVDWAKEKTDTWAACINLMDTHEPYVPKEEFIKWADQDLLKFQEKFRPSSEDLLNGDGWEDLTRLEDLYDDTLLQVDSIIKYLIKDLKQNDLYDDTLLIITSDHGEAFGETSRLDKEVRLGYHQWGIDEVLTHVPLIVKYPRQKEGEVINNVVSLTDLPKMIKSSINDGVDDYNYTSSEPVLSSTFRLLRDKMTDMNIRSDKLTRFCGPWRSVYVNNGQCIRKYSQRGNSYIVEDIYSPFNKELVSKDGTEKVADIYSSLGESDIHKGETAIANDVEEQLKHLGYVR